MAEAQTNENNAENSSPSASPKNKRSGSAWSLQRCRKRAKRFASVKDWYAGHPSSYKAALHWNWIKDCCAHMDGALDVIAIAKPARKKPARTKPTTAQAAPKPRATQTAKPKVKTKKKAAKKTKAKKATKKKSA